MILKKIIILGLISWFFSSLFFVYAEVNSILFGVHLAENNIKEDIVNFERVNDLQLKVVRLPVDWAQLEPKKWNINQDYLNYLKKRVRVAAKNWLKVVILFSQSPQWANWNMPPYVPPLREFNTYYAKALIFLMYQLQSDDNILAWEIWNEPNSIEFWPKFEEPRKDTYVLTPLEGAKEYYALLNTSYKLAKRYFPQNIVLGASLASADIDYLAALWDNFSWWVPMDWLSLHPYTRVDEVDSSHYWYAQYPDQCNLEDPLSPPWCFEEGLKNIKKFLDSKKFDGGIWITEFWVSSGKWRWEAWTEKEQLKFLIKAIKILSKYWMKSKRDIKVAIWYRLRDEGDDRFWLYDEDWNIKLAGRFFRYFLKGSNKIQISSKVRLRINRFIQELDENYNDLNIAEILTRIVLSLKRKYQIYKTKSPFLEQVISLLKWYEDKYYLKTHLR